MPLNPEQEQVAIALIRGQNVQALADRRLRAALGRVVALGLPNPEHPERTRMPPLAYALQSSGALAHRVVHMLLTLPRPGIPRDSQGSLGIPGAAPLAWLGSQPARAPRSGGACACPSRSCRTLHNARAPTPRPGSSRSGLWIHHRAAARPGFKGAVLFE